MEKAVFRRMIGLIGLSVVVSLTACKKPSYSDYKVDEHGTVRNDNKQEPAAKPLDPESDLKQSGAMASQAESPRKEGVQMPDFFDRQRGRVKDLPLYPRSQATNIQFGPMGGLNVVMQVFRTSDKFETVTAFFDHALKAGEWKIASNDRGADLYTWELTKGASDQAAIQVERQKEQGIVFIVLRRAQPIAPAASK